MNGAAYRRPDLSDENTMQCVACVTVQRDLLFIDDKDAVVLGGDAWHRVLTGHLSLIVTGGKKQRERREKKEEISF